MARSEFSSRLRCNKDDCQYIRQKLLQAREAERKAIAHDLHDQIIQKLVGLIYETSGKYRDCVSSDQVRSVQATIRALIGDVRNVCQQLRPPVLDCIGLVAAMQEFILNQNQYSTYQITFQTEGDAERRMPEDIEVCLYRVLQEVITNVQKHASANHVDVILKMYEDWVFLSIQDDGCGFRVPEHIESLRLDQHFGLIGLLERVELVHGELRIISRPQQGTCVQVCVPLCVSRCQELEVADDLQSTTCCDFRNQQARVDITTYGREEAVVQ